LVFLFCLYLEKFSVKLINTACKQRKKCMNATEG
jgi:hypothetical protein